MSKTIKSIRGMHDILPAQTVQWQYLEAQLQSLLRRYGYHEIRMPVVEMTQLFSRSIGEVTDIVEKEMYSFEDRNGDGLTLRPEGTASSVRACIQAGLLHNQTQRLWYMGPMFRHERPQKGRYRQFHQIGVEAFGMVGPDIDAELIMMSARLWQELGLDGIRLELNSLGSNEARTAYRSVLTEYLSANQELLDEDSRRRLHTNPLRVLDSKNPDLRDLIVNAPKLADHLDDESRRHFELLQDMLTSAGIEFTINPNLVRGLDYYCKTVFEWVTDKLGAQGTVCAGGRYDGLVEQLGGKQTPAAGFAIGLERLLAMLEDEGLVQVQQQPDLYLVLLGEKAEVAGMKLAETIRTALPDINLMMNCGGGSFKSQLKKADKSGAQLAIILGDDELSKRQVLVKYLREQQEQINIALDELVVFLHNR